MKPFLLILFVTLLTFQVGYGQIQVTEVGALPQPVSNNAVVGATKGKTPYLYSFAGIDTTTSNFGIHLHSYRVNLATGQSEILDDLPDSLGKIGCAASRIGDIIYITGGYHVYPNHAEKSSNKMHRFSLTDNTFLPDGPNIPVATDDHVQTVWRDSLLFLITGWSDNGNIPNVQIFNPATNEWSTGTAVPNNNAYTSFGASGLIIEDTIYYFGGASSSAGFNIQPWLRKGVIHPLDPTEIDWTFSRPDPKVAQYRGAAIEIQNTPHWIGGASKTYNYDGMAYDGSGGVLPTKHDYSLVDNQWTKQYHADLPMDLRGIVKLNDSAAYIAGGMNDQQEVISTIYRLNWGNYNVNTPIKEKSGFTLTPNPFSTFIHVESDEHLHRIELFNCHGQSLSVFVNPPHDLNTGDLYPGYYFIQVHSEKGTSIHRVIKL